jgi:hypothetical protein
MLRTVLGLTALLLLGGVTTPTRLAAQDCGANCNSCGALGSEGVNFTDKGGWDMDCSNFSLHCDICLPEPQRANSGDTTEELLLLLRTGDAAAVRTAIALNEDRLRMSPGRNLVVLFGTKCDDAAVGAVAYVTAARAALLRGYGVSDWIAPTTLATTIK